MGSARSQQDHESNSDLSNFETAFNPISNSKSPGLSCWSPFLCEQRSLILPLFQCHFLAVIIPSSVISRTVIPVNNFSFCWLFHISPLTLSSVSPLSLSCLSLPPHRSSFPIHYSQNANELLFRL